MHDMQLQYKTLSPPHFCFSIMHFGLHQANYDRYFRADITEIAPVPSYFLSHMYSTLFVCVLKAQKNLMNHRDHVQAHVII